VWELGVLLVLLGLAAARLGRYLDDTSFGACGQAFAAGVLMRFVGAGLVLVGVLRIAGVL
jgi:hypothetical protein